MSDSPGPAVTLNAAQPPASPPNQPAPIHRDFDPARNGWEEAQDAKGRWLCFKSIDALEQLDLTEACAERSEITRLFGMALIAATVRAIDNDVIAFPRDYKTVRNLVAKLGSEGMESTAAWMARKRQAAEDAADAKLNVTAKN